MKYMTFLTIPGRKDVEIEWPNNWPPPRQGDLGYLEYEGIGINFKVITVRWWLQTTKRPDPHIYIELLTTAQHVPEGWTS